MAAPRSTSLVHLLFSFSLLVGLFSLRSTPPALAATQIDIHGPSGSGTFGDVTVLTNGNFVVVDIGYDAGAIPNVGAVYLYNGATKSLIATLTGSTAYDFVGIGGITVLSNGNYVVASPSWQSSSVMANVGAVTWCSGSSGCTGAVSSTNSLVGSTVGDQVGLYNVLTLSNGNYVITSSSWDQPSPATADVGAVTWCSGNNGCTGAISSTNSLVGSTVGDQVGRYGSFILSNGNYVIASPSWDQPSPALADVGAVSLCSGGRGCTGRVSSANSLVGTITGDWVGGAFGVTALSNGNYVVTSLSWDQPSPAIVDVGAVTWCSGNSGCTGRVSSTNSLIGSTTGDFFDSPRVTSLSNGNYVIASQSWDQPSPAIVDVGAVTWCSGGRGCIGVISSASSLVGTTARDRVGTVTALSNDNYVVASQSWDQPSQAIADMGAVTWCSGSSGCTGSISSGNSLIGSAANDQVGNVTALSNSNYVVASPSWDQPSPAVAGVGAVSLCSGSGGCIGTISSDNSLVGSTDSDFVGSAFGVTALSNGNYVVASSSWDQPSPSIPDVGAVSLCDGRVGCAGLISHANSALGAATGSGVRQNVVYDTVNGQLFVGWRADNSISIFKLDSATPTITNVTTASANGIYLIDTVIPITVSFNDVVFVTGTPQLTLETGAIHQVVDYSNGSGTTTLTFNYTVHAGDTSADLDYVDTAALTLNGGTIRGAGLNEAILTLAAPGTAGSLGASKALVIAGDRVFFPLVRHQA